MSLNTCTISGNLGRTCELRYTAGGTQVVTFSVAVNNRRRQADGTYDDEVNWVDCVMYGKRAESLEPYLVKGSKVSLVGHLRQHKWENAGVKHSRIEVLVDSIEFMGGRRVSQEGGDADPDSSDYHSEEVPF